MPLLLSLVSTRTLLAESQIFMLLSVFVNLVGLRTFLPVHNPGSKCCCDILHLTFLSLVIKQFVSPVLMLTFYLQNLFLLSFETWGVEGLGLGGSRTRAFLAFVAKWEPRRRSSFACDGTTSSSVSRPPSQTCGTSPSLWTSPSPVMAESRSRRTKSSSLLAPLPSDTFLRRTQPNILSSFFG